MLKLTEARRDALPNSAFAVIHPRARTEKGRRKYPVFDRAHARNALARVARFGSPAEKAAVCRKVHRNFPDIHETHCSLRHRRMEA